MAKKLVFGAIFTALIMTPVSYSNELDWEIEKETNGIQVFTRIVEGSPLKEFKGSILIALKHQDLVSILKNVDSYHLWMPDVAESKIIESTDVRHVHYVKLDMPWPVTDRDGIYEFSYNTDGQGNTKVLVSALPDKQEAVKNSIRIPYANGMWLFEELDSNKTKVTYQMHAEPGGSLPAWLINSSVIDTPYNTLTSLKAYAEKVIH